MLKTFDINPMVKKYVESQKELFEKITEEYLEYYSDIITIKEEQIFRLKRFREFIQHLETSIKEIFGDTFTLEKRVFHNVERYYGYTCEVVIRDLDKMIVVHLGYAVKNINLVYLKEFEEELKYFKGDR